MTPQSRPSIMVIECRDDRPSEIRSHLRWARGRRSLRRAERMRARRRAVVSKSLGGSPANVAVGASRQGLRVAMLSRVGDEPMGKFVRDELEREGVDVGHVAVDPRRVTGLAFACARDGADFSLLFYRENFADLALSIDDVDAEFIADARALLVTGTHFSTPTVEAASRAAMRFAKAGGTRIILDVDHRPILWGDQRGACTRTSGPEGRATHCMASIVADRDLVVGTGKMCRWRVDTLSVALRNLRARTRPSS